MFTFSKQERLSSHKIIDLIFQQGKSVSYRGFTLFYLFTALPSPFPVQLGTTAPKKSFKHAHDRNLIKRRMREAFRKNKWTIYPLLASKQKQVAIMLVYKGKTLPDYALTAEAVESLLKKLQQSI